MRNEETTYSLLVPQRSYGPGLRRISIIFVFYVQFRFLVFGCFISVARSRIRCSKYPRVLALAKSSTSSRLKSGTVSNVRRMKQYARGRLIIWASWAVTENRAAASEQLTFSTTHIRISCVTNTSTETLSESLIAASTVNNIFAMHVCMYVSLYISVK